MSEDSTLRNSWVAFIGGGLLGISLGVAGLFLLLRYGIGTELFLDSVVPSTNQTSGSSPTDGVTIKPQHWLRLIQAVGILLPLFTGLLRLTTSEQSEVNQDLTIELVAGITTLLFAGSAAVGGLIAMNPPAFLQAALFFVLLTFGIIGFAAARIFTEAVVRRDSERPHPATGQQKIEPSPLNTLLSVLTRIGQSLRERGGSDSDSNSPKGDRNGDAETEDGSPTETEDDIDDE